MSGLAAEIYSLARTRRPRCSSESGWRSGAIAIRLSSLRRSDDSYLRLLLCLNALLQYSTCWKRYVPKEELPQRTQYVGNSTKSLHVSVHASLKKLRTDYIDILYVHSWDYTTTIEEMMNSLHNLVVQGKVLYLGVSDTPAWVVSEANTYARLAGKTPFIIYQGPWNIMQRDVERDILPMCIKHGMFILSHQVPPS